MSTSLPYNIKDPLSIEVYAKKLLNKSLKDVLGNHIAQTYSGKGKLGQILEDLYFKYKPNSKSEPDFKEAGVELKTTPVKQSVKGLISKERLVFNIINYEEAYKESFLSSSFWKKNKLILLMFYLHEHDKIELEYLFKIVQLWEFPSVDLKIIKDDWQTIINKIKEGKAHEISEGDTLYLAACTKGANKASLRTQPFSNEKAMQRAFSLKSRYLNFIIEKGLKEQTEPIVKNITDYDSGETFEEHVIKRFKPYYNLSEDEIIAKLKLFSTTAKSRFYLISKAILGVEKGSIEEFEKADILMKTIRLEMNGTLKESMSFSQIQFEEIVTEKWEESYWFNTLTKRFFLVVFKKDKKGKLRLMKVMFWSMPVGDLLIAKNFWNDTKYKIKKDDFQNFVKISDDKICHVRPKGINSKDLMKTPSGRMEKKKSYWLNSSYIKMIVNDII